MAFNDGNKERFMEKVRNAQRLLGQVVEMWDVPLEKSRNRIGELMSEARTLVEETQKWSRESEK